MHLARKLIKGAKVVWAFGYSLTTLVLTRPQTRRARAEWLTRFCRRVLRATNTTWGAIGPVPERGAVITNHLTYVDILVHAALRPCVFVSAIETRKMPLIGWISMMAGTVYVTRGAGGSAAQAASGMAEGFHDGLPVVFFPEGGTGVGDVPLLPLHSGLLANALEAGASVTPGFLSYHLSPEDVAEGRTTRDDVAWGQQKLPAHIWNFLGLRAVRGEVQFASGPIPFTPEAFADRKIAASEAETAMLVLVNDQKKSPIVAT
jgi:lyso-ornithine lipid O-acyltransferase